VIGDAVEHIGTDEITKLEALLATWEQRIQAGEEYSDLDESFHEIIYGVLDNQSLMKLFSAFWISFTSLENEITHDPDPEAVISFHRSILEAIKTRDPGLVRKQLSQHFDHIKERVKHYLMLSSVER